MKRSKRLIKTSPNLKSLFKMHQCRNCSVKICRMDFEKILGKFTRVKIQYENSPKRKGKMGIDSKSPTTNTRLKNNENGMVLIHRNAYSQHPVKDALFQKNKKPANSKGDKSRISSPRLQNHVSKENKPSKVSTRIKNYKTKSKESPIPFKFKEPVFNNNKIIKNYSKNKLADLIEHIDHSILPSDDWCMDIFPENVSPKDIVYDKIAAELENLMNNEKENPCEKTDTKSDDFPSILDILNENATDSSRQVNNNNADLTSNFATNDIEAMLLDESEPYSKISSKVSKDDVNIQQNVPSHATEPEIEEPGSPSILVDNMDNKDDELQPEQNINTKDKTSKDDENMQCGQATNINGVAPRACPSTKPKLSNVTHVIFKRMHAGVCHCSVKLTRTLKYMIELDSKPVELLGAPKFVSSKEDTKMLLQIINECKLASSFVWDKSLKP